MIPSDSLFSHLQCGFGAACDRPYCLYSHPPRPPTSNNNNAIGNTASVSSGDVRSNNNNGATTAEYGNYTSHQQHVNVSSISATSTSSGSNPVSFSVQIAQEENPYDDAFAAYHGYMAAHQSSGTAANAGPATSSSDAAAASISQGSDDFPAYHPFEFEATNTTTDTPAQEEEDVGQFIPARPRYDPKPAKSKPPPEKKRKHHEYSVLNDKPSIPIDLGNDEILLGLSSAHKKPTPAPPAKKRAPISATTTISIKHPQRKPATSSNKTGNSKTPATKPTPYTRPSASSTKNPTSSTATTNRISSAANNNNAALQPEVKATVYVPPKQPAAANPQQPPAKPPAYVPQEVFFLDAKKSGSSAKELNRPSLSPSAHLALDPNDSALNVSKSSAASSSSRTKIATSGSGSSSRQSSPAPAANNVSRTGIDMEKELREIEILERKTRLMKEYKKLAEEILELESKQKNPNAPDFIQTMLSDASDIKPSSSSTSIGEPPPAKIQKIESSSARRESPPEKREPPSAAGRESAPSNKAVPFREPTSRSVEQPRKVAVIAPTKSDPLKAAIQSVRTSIAATTSSSATTRPSLTTVNAGSSSTVTKSSSINDSRQAMVNRFFSASKPTPASSTSKSKWTLNQKKQTPATTAPKSNACRVAHAPQTLELIPLDKHNGKISFTNRVHCLKKLYEEFRKYEEISPDQAVEMAQREEKLLLDRCQGQTGYTSSLAGAVRGIRNKQFALPVVNSQGVTVSEPATITEIMQKERQSTGKSLTEEQFYTALREKYLMTADQLKQNRYPMVVKCEDGKKRVMIDEGADGSKKMFVNDDDLKRTCCRCGTEYRLKPDGSFVSAHECIYHPKRAFKKRINRTMESRYACCDSDLTVKGCVVSDYHVHDVLRQSTLSQFIRTPPPSGPDDPRSNRVYAFDCEMVYTTWGMHVARLTVVDWQDNLTLDILIKPGEKVLDCNTRFSGLTPDMLEDAPYTLDTARKKFFEYVNSETVLIGHSLESDLKAMRLVHKRVVDTAIVFPHRLGPPMKRALRNLASDYLQKIIQEDVEGHDSKEDASTCMLLMLKKVREDIV